MHKDSNTMVLMGHGSGGRMMHELIEKVFAVHFADPLLDVQADAAVFPSSVQHLAFTTDGFVVQPLFFPGGNIGKLSVCGTVNDLAAVGAVPRYLSAGFIIEEGFPMALLEEIVESMAITAREAGVRIVCGDTKVVGNGQCDELFITTAGIGEVDPSMTGLASGSMIRVGDHVILNGTLGDHGMAVLAARNQLEFSARVESDCAPLNKMVGSIVEAGLPVHFMRDPTRGGLAAVLCEVTQHRNFGIVVEESSIPVSDPVRGMCELYGFDPLHIANEGKMVIITPPEHSAGVVSLLRQSQYGGGAVVIGRVSGDIPGEVLMNTLIGGTRIITMPTGEQLPRIC